MKNLLLLIGIIFCSIQFSNAQGISKPLADLVENEVITEAPNDHSIWIKGHWQYSAGKYYWIEGAHISPLANHNWVEGKWVKNQITDKWTYQTGQWEPIYNEITYNGTVYRAGVETTGSKVELLQALNYSLN